jgi:thioredoxin-related protein
MAQLNLSAKQMVIYKRIVMLTFLTLTLSSCGIATETDAPKNTETLDSSNIEQLIIEKEISMYEGLLESDNVEKISLLDLKKLSENITENKLIYFGRPTCMYCRKLFIENGKRFEDSNMKILYVDTDRIPKDEKIILENYGIEEVPSFIQMTGNGNFDKVETAEFERMIDHE